MTKDQLEKLYQGHSQEQIAKILCISRASVFRLMRKHHVKQRTYAAASSFMNEQRTIIFNKEQEQLVYGSLLGDACLHRSIMKSNKTKRRFVIYKLHFAHCVDQLPYLIYKQSIIGGSKIGTRISGHGSVINHFAFSHTPTLKTVAKICHSRRHKKHITQSWLNKLDWLGIAFWYMDDGDLIISKKRPIIRFHTESFSFSELRSLQAMLCKRFDLKTRLSKSPNPNPRERILCSKHQHEAIIFLRRLAPFILPCFAYKLRILNDVRFAHSQSLQNRNMDNGIA